MFSIRRLFQVGVVGLTALMTLVSGMPRIDCICPNGNVKFFCLKTLIGKSGCCCAEACCEKPSEPKSPAKSCCHCENEQAPSKSDSQTRQCPCHVKLTEATASVIASSPEVPPQASAAGMAAIEFSPLALQVGDVPRTAVGYPPQPLPPTDLLATCKHLLI